MSYPHMIHNRQSVPHPYSHSFCWFFLPIFLWFSMRPGPARAPAKASGRTASPIAPSAPSAQLKRPNRRIRRCFRGGCRSSFAGWRMIPGLPSMGEPHGWMVFKMDDLGVLLFQETSMCFMVFYSGLMGLSGDDIGMTWGFEDLPSDNQT